METTRKRFQKRVEFERKILQLTNSHFSTTPLYGLSKPAICIWQFTYPDKVSDSIVEKLSELSKHLMLFCDNSRNTFDIGQTINADKMNIAIESYRDMLAIL
jgi:hypothetical protein